MDPIKTLTLSRPKIPSKGFTPSLTGDAKELRMLKKMINVTLKATYKSLAISKSNPKMNLNHLPHEVFSKICGYLEPRWLLNLSQSCSSAHSQLSGQESNLIWYGSMPPSLYALQPLFKLPFEQFECTTYRDHDGSSAKRRKIAHDVTDHDTEMANVPALGGPYHHGFNYKGEIIGRLCAEVRCSCCLQRASANGRQCELGPDRWLWCEGCKNEYTIGK